jgi:hypothetical protein
VSCNAKKLWLSLLVEPSKLKRKSVYAKKGSVLISAAR